ncbi:MAG: ribonuclease H [Ignavibacteria bacterium]|nr:ribonuclease H [Ignavibacteria bacterium]
MQQLFLFTDGSVNTKSKIGYGAYLSIRKFDVPLENLKQLVKVRRFENTSSTKMELQILLWSLSEIDSAGKEIIIYTDSQNITGLSGRRKRFEANNYRSNQGKLLNNYLLYQEFFRLTDLLNCKFVKVSGHLVSERKDEIDRIFTLVDRASRNALRKDGSAFSGENIKV